MKPKGEFTRPGTPLSPVRLYIGRYIVLWAHYRRLTIIVIKINNVFDILILKKKQQLSTKYIILYVNYIHI